MKLKLLFSFALVIFILVTGCDMQTRKITFESLLNEMTEREQLARFPDPAYTVKQFSSYNKASQISNHFTWFANLDNNSFIRTDSINGRREFVLFDAAGPGAVVRLWTTWNRYNKNGTLRFYFDHEEEPRIEGEPMSLISGGKLVGSPLSFSVSEETVYERRGHNLYLPIPYAKHLKITYETEGIFEARGRKTSDDPPNPREEMFYYQINYRTYEPDVRVESFDIQHLNQYAQVINETLDRLAGSHRELDGLKLQTENFSEKLSPGWKKDILIEGGQAIRKLEIKLEAENIEQALRTTIISASFDGDRTIWAPVGDFFGAGYKIIPARTWYQEVHPDGTMSVFWVMPFKESCQLSIVNYGDQVVDIVHGEVVTTPWNWDSRSMHFGTSWHQYTRINTGLFKGRSGKGDMYDLNFVTLNGQGVFVGDGLTLFDCSPAWWGEGDEKIFVDHEEFPSHFGTGTEDYYGYAWCRPEPFIHPFIAQPEGSGNLDVGYTVNQRYRTLDAIPFREHFHFDMEMWHWASTIMNYAPVTYWYIKPGGFSEIQPDIQGAQEEVVLKRDQIFPPVMDQDGVIEGADLIVSGLTGSGSTRIAPIPQPDRPRWDKSMKLWANASPGDEITLQFISDEAGTYGIETSFHMMRGSARVGVSVNGRTELPSIGLNASERGQKSIKMNGVELMEGINELTYKILESSYEDGSNYGIDYLKFNRL